MESRSYKTPEAFRMALEQRIRSATRRPAVSINRFRQLLVFDRFLARVSQHFSDRVIVKGGLVLELRLDRVRTTKDVDLRVVGDPEGVLAAIRAAGLLDLGDWITFLVEPDLDMPTIKNEGMIYEGLRFRGDYERMAREDDLPWTTLDGVYEVARAFLDPVLAGKSGTWDSETWTWCECVAAPILNP